MSRLSEIPIKVTALKPAEPIEVGNPGLGLDGSAAILIELTVLLERLAEAKLSGAIDLHSMPMSELDREKLQTDLGRGEVRAFLDADGTSEFQETGVPGIWWVQHRDKSGEIIAELIEVTTFPEILARADDEIAQGLRILRERSRRSPPNTQAEPPHAC